MRNKRKLTKRKTAHHYEFDYKCLTCEFFSEKFKCCVECEDPDFCEGPFEPDDPEDDSKTE